MFLSVWSAPVQAEPPDSSAIKIGALMVLSGEFAMQGAAFREGVGIAQEEINSGGGIAGRSLRVIIEDTHSDPKFANSAAQKLISVDKIVAAITTSYPETEVGGAQFQRAHIPSIALWDSSPQIDAMGDYIFAIGPWTPSDAEVGAAFCVEKLKAKRASIINTVEPWSELIADLFSKSIEALGGKVVQRFRVNPGDADFRTLLAKIKSESPDVLYAPLTNEVVPFHTQKLLSRLAIPVLSAGIITEEHVLQNPAAFEGVYQTGIKDPQRPEMTALAMRYEKKFGKKLTLPWFVATGYDAVMLYGSAIRIVGADSERIKEFLYTVKNFPGAAQTISISAAGSSPYFASMFRVEKGKFVLVN